MGVGIANNLLILIEFKHEAEPYETANFLIIFLFTKHPIYTVQSNTSEEK